MKLRNFLAVTIVLGTVSSVSYAGDYCSQSNQNNAWAAVQSRKPYAVRKDAHDFLDYCLKRDLDRAIAEYTGRRVPESRNCTVADVLTVRSRLNNPYSDIQARIDAANWLGMCRATPTLR